MNRRLLGALLVATSAVSFGSMPLFGRWAQESGTSTPGLIFVRFVLAAVALVAITRWRGTGRVPRGKIAAVAALGGIGYVGQAYCYLLGIEHADVSLVALLLYLYPAFVAVLAAVFLRERIGVVTLAALAVSLAGTALVVGGGTGEPVGIALGVGAAVVYSIYITIGSVVTRDLDPLATATVVTVAACVSSGLIVLGILVTGHGVPLAGSARGWVGIVAMGLVCTVVSIVTFFAGLALLGPTSTSVLSTLEPVVTVVLATTLLSEVLSPAQAVGGALVLGAVVWLALSQRQPDEVPPPA